MTFAAGVCYETGFEGYRTNRRDPGMEHELAILFVDVCDSTRLYERFGNVRAAEVIGSLLGRLEGEVTGVRGKVIKSLGDGLMCVFVTPERACRAAVQMMSAVAAEKLEGCGALSLRVGLHFGSVVSNGGDVFGDAINVASRVEAMASPGEILLTEAAVNRLSAPVSARCRLIDTTRVKGKTVAIRIYTLLERTAEDSLSERTVIGSAMMSEAVRAASFSLRIMFGDQEKIVGMRAPKLTIGRHESCDIVVQSPLASRQHGSVEFSRESFLLTDHSSNGTFVRAGNGPPVPLRREASKLVGWGLIGIGAVPERPEQDHVLRFASGVDF